MSDDVDITYGGAISVDTWALRSIVSGLGVVVRSISEAEAALRQAYSTLTMARRASQVVDTVALWASADRVEALRGECRKTMDNTALMADVYELVELRAEQEALVLTDAVAADALQTRINRLAGSDSRIPVMAEWLLAGWREGRFEGLHNDLGVGKLISAFGLAPITYGTAALGALGGFGTVKAGTVLRGTAEAVAIRPVQTSTAYGPPGSLAEGFRRFPTAPGAQIRVERYAMPDGSQRFILYAKGTQSATFGGEDPWDMESNRQLYTNERSSSYQATVDALKASGAQPGDVVNAYAHSQSGMIVAHLAMESEFDVQVQVTAGSPVQPTLDDDQLLIQLSHTDDLVRALAGGGAPAGTGSPDSFVAQRVGDPVDSVQDLVIQAHHLETYIETAEMVDASGDPRLSAIRETWQELSEAVEIQSTEYVAVRTE